MLLQQIFHRKVRGPNKFLFSQNPRIIHQFQEIFDKNVLNRKRFSIILSTTCTFKIYYTCVICKNTSVYSAEKNFLADEISEKFFTPASLN